MVSLAGVPSSFIDHERNDMHRKTRRPAYCEPGSFNNADELGRRLRLSRERLAASDLAGQGQAWRLWAACADATFGYAREADQIYLTTLARNAADVHRNAASRIMRRFDELGVFGWHAAPRGSHGISLLSLPPLHAPSTVHEDRLDAPLTVHEDAHAPSTVHEDGATCSAHGALQSNEVKSIELITNSSPIATGTQHHHSPVIGPSEGVEGSDDWHAERRANPETRPEPDAFDDLDAAVQAAYADADLAVRFPPFHEDQRTGDGVGDDEASQLRWEAANPHRTRARGMRN